MNVVYHRAVESVRAHLAILSVTGSATGVAMENIVADAVSAAGHQISAFESVKDSEVAIRAQLTGWIEDSDIDLVLVLGEGTQTSRALAPLIEEPLPGFADLLRMLAFQEIGAAAMRSTAEAARCGGTFVFVLPANENAVRAAMEKLILPQLDPRTPQNLIADLPRLRDEAEVTRVDHASGPADNIPLPIEKEKTRSGGMPEPRLPAKPSAPVATMLRTKSRTGQNVLLRKVEDPTKPIELQKLERQLELSKTGGEPTKAMAHPLPDKEGSAPVAVAPPPTKPATSAKPPTTPPRAAKFTPHAPSPVKPPATIQPPRAAKPTPHVPIVAKPAAVLVEEVPAKPAAVLVDEEAIEEANAPTLDLETPVVTLPAKTPIADPEEAPTIRAEPVRARTPSAPKPAPVVEPPRPRPITAAPDLPRPRAPSSELPQGDLTFPPLRRSKLPIVILLLGTVAAGAVIVYFVTRPPMPDREPTQVAATPDAAVVATIEIDAAVVEPPETEIEMPADSTTPLVKKPPRVPDRRPRDTPPENPTAAPPDAAPVVVADGECDETACVMENYARACCARFKPANTDVQPIAPDSLAKSQIRTGMERVRAAVIECGAKANVSGTVKVSVVVDGEGVVQGVDVQATPDAALGTCVAGAVRKARFAKTANGGSFTYPFVF